MTNRYNINDLADTFAVEAIATDQRVRMMLRNDKPALARAYANRAVRDLLAEAMDNPAHRLYLSAIKVEALPGPVFASALDDALTLALRPFEEDDFNL